MNHQLIEYCKARVDEAPQVNPMRKDLLDRVAAYIAGKQQKKQPAHLIYICTHNARRSFFGQVWARVAADWFGLQDIFTHSGGAEETAFHPNSIAALERAGLNIKRISGDDNPVYHVLQNDQANHPDDHPLVCFSKRFDDPSNPQEKFAAIMVCSNAEQSCPFVPGAELRISITYDDPKEFDNTVLQDAKYDERCAEIATEMFYVFSRVIINNF
jgi:arsenate reductase (thioredoxin)